jgi:hypothetical protein
MHLPRQSGDSLTLRDRPERPEVGDVPALIAFAHHRWPRLTLCG